MANVTIHNLSEETQRALTLRAARHDRSVEAEMRAILEAAVLPKTRVRLGTTMAKIGRRNGLTNADVEVIERAHYSKIGSC